MRVWFGFGPGLKWADLWVGSEFKNIPSWSPFKSPGLTINSSERVSSRAFLEWSALVLWRTELIVYFDFQLTKLFSKD